MYKIFLIKLIFWSERRVSKSGGPNPNFSFKAIPFFFHVINQKNSQENIRVSPKWSKIDTDSTVPVFVPAPK